jgi:hypothetical protein
MLNTLGVRARAVSVSASGMGVRLGELFHGRVSSKEPTDVAQARWKSIR